MHSSTHHAGMPLNHLVSKGAERYWTYKQNGIRRMKPFVPEYFEKAPKDKDYNVKGYLVNSDGGMVHVGKNNEVTFYKDMNAKQKKKAAEIKQLNEKIKNNPKGSKPADSQEQTKPKIDPNDFHQKVFFPRNFNFLSWKPEVKSYFINRNKENKQFYFEEIKQNIKNEMPQEALRWFENKKTHLLAMQKKSHGAHAQPQSSQKKTSAVSTNLDSNEIAKMKEKMGRIEIIKNLHDTIAQLERTNTKWPNTQPTQFLKLLENFFFQYEHKQLLFEGRDESLNIRGKLIEFKNIVEDPNQDFGEDDVLKAFSCYIHEKPHTFNDIKEMDAAVVSIMTKNLITSLQELKSELFKILLAHEKKQKQKEKEEKRAKNAAAALGLDSGASNHVIAETAEEKLNSSDNRKIPIAALYFVLQKWFNEIPLQSNDKFSFNLSNLLILTFILTKHPNMPLNFFQECFTVTDQCNDCLNHIKNEAKKFYSLQQAGNLLNPGN